MLPGKFVFFGRKTELTPHSCVDITSGKTNIRYLMRGQKSMRKNVGGACQLFFSLSACPPASLLHVRLARPNWLTCRLFYALHIPVKKIRDRHEENIALLLLLWHRRLSPPPPPRFGGGVTVFLLLNCSSRRRRRRCSMTLRLSPLFLYFSLLFFRSSRVLIYGLVL